MKIRDMSKIHSLIKVGCVRCYCLRPHFMSNVVHRMAFGTPKFHVGLYVRISHGLINLGPVVQN